MSTEMKVTVPMSMTDQTLACHASEHAERGQPDRSHLPWLLR